MPAVVVAGPEPALDQQVLVTANHGIAFPKDKVDRRWNEDYFITSLAYSSNGWAIVMSKTAQWSNQVYKITTDWPDAWIKERSKDGYYITAVASDGKNWATALSRGSGITDQWAATNHWEVLLPHMTEKSRDGWMVTSLVNNGSLWTIVMSKGTIFSDQACEYAYSADDINRSVERQRMEGRILTTLGADDERYILIFSRILDGLMPAQNVNQVFDTTRSLFKTEVEAGMKVLFIGG